MPRQNRLAACWRACVLCLCLAAPAAWSATLDQVRLLATGTRDGAAVLQLADQQMVVLKAGDAVPGTGAVVLKVAADKLVLEEGGAPGQARQLVWMYKTGRIERFASHVAGPEFAAPPTGTVSSLPAAGKARGASLSPPR